MIRETMTWKDKEQRVNALKDLEAFNTFLRRGGFSSARAPLSPARAREHLSRDDVRGLLGSSLIRRYEKAAEVLL